MYTLENFNESELWNNAGTVFAQKLENSIKLTKYFGKHRGSAISTSVRNIDFSDINVVNKALKAAIKQINEASKNTDLLHGCTSYI